MESPELEGLKKLRTGFLIFIALYVVAVALVFTTAGSAIGVLGRGIEALSAFMALLWVIVAAVVALAVLSLVALVIYIRGGYGKLAQVDHGFGICRMGVTVLIAGVVVALAGLFSMVAWVASVVGWAFSIAERATTSHPGQWKGLPPDFLLSPLLAAVGVLIIGGILVLVGWVLAFIVGAFKLNEKYKESLFQAAGILYIVDIVLLFLGLGGILTLVGHILMYIGLGSAINRVAASAQTQTPSSATEKPTL